jgi:hypothetical protein
MKGAVMSGLLRSGPKEFPHILFLPFSGGVGVEWKFRAPVTPEEVKGIFAWVQGDNVVGEALFEEPVCYVFAPELDEVPMIEPEGRLAVIVFRAIAAVSYYRLRGGEEAALPAIQLLEKLFGIDVLQIQRAGLLCNLRRTSERWGTWQVKGENLGPQAG